VVLDRVEPESGVDVEFHSVDLMDAGATREALRRVTAAHEVTRLVNNVGIVRPAPAEATTIEDFADVVNLNARAALLCVQAVLPAMRRARHGRIVSVTSRVVLGKELRTAYSASKGALAAMTRTWALEFAGDGITVNAVAPGPIGTAEFNRNNPPDSQRTRDIVDRVPVGRLGTPDDVAHAVRFFLDQRSGFVTGQTLYVCGGLTVGLAAAP
jgi:NAD(P)-dependent dehydrogenase (short-subunit alcohol dehydrogenase family)